MKNTFISKLDLAQAYFPYIQACNARQKLMHLIADDMVLVQKLHEAGYNKKSHSFSPVQAGLIMERLGNPWRK